MNWEGYEALGDYVDQRAGEGTLIDIERREVLSQLAARIREEIENEKQVQLIFICTHNSRRSQMGQIWALLAARYYEVDGIRCYSGGTEATAFNPRAVKAMQDAGMTIRSLNGSANPSYAVSFEKGMKEIKAFSKKYSDPPNPTHGFIAVMTCSDADDACPIVFGAVSRFSIRYEDPKASDGTREEESRYEERCRHIAREMLYLFSEV
jgi:protein-tyrosine-phosphatase